MRPHIGKNLQPALRVPVLRSIQSNSRAKPDHKKGRPPGSPQKHYGYGLGTKNSLEDRVYMFGMIVHVKELIELFFGNFCRHRFICFQKVKQL